jgi:signal transduction histidine kinase
MPVDINDILHVLAHELRTPVGIAHGYVRLLLEDRLPQEGDRRRALEQMQKALVRLSDLSNETTALAAWYEHAAAAGEERADARALIDRVSTAAYEWPVTVNIGDVTDGAGVRTRDSRILGNALVDIVRATARELRGQPCAVSARVDNHRLELLAGPADHLSALGAGPDGPEAGPLSLERGGLGLTLVHAAVVLDAHRAQRWGMKGSRSTAGIRLPLEERPLP